jgi:uncharacterized protein YggE
MPRALIDNELEGIMLKATSYTIRTAIVVAAVVVIQSAALAQERVDRSHQPAIRVTGEATVAVKPDQAVIDIGVVTQAQSAQAAATQNAQKTDAVIADLRKAMGAGADIKTISYSLSPNYRYPREGGQPTIAGYIASNIVQVKMSDLTQVGKIIDLATQSGANNIHGLRFTLKDEFAARSKALAEAAIQARAKADTLASALRLKVVRILQVEEGGSVGALPPIMYSRAEAAQATTPVEPGTIDVRATVVLTVEISQ